MDQSRNERERDESEIKRSRTWTQPSHVGSVSPSTAFFKKLLILVGACVLLQYFCPLSLISETSMRLQTLRTVTLLAGLIGATPLQQQQHAESWHKYVQSPSSTTVLPVSIIASLTNGNVTNPEAVLGSVGTATLTRLKEQPRPKWPNGTRAETSSFHSANIDGDYIPSNAIDGNVTTFWNDNTTGAYPDTLTIYTTSITLTGITVLSPLRISSVGLAEPDGVPVEFVVEVLASSPGESEIWITGGAVTNNSDVLVPVPFDQTYTTTGIRITVQKDQDAGSATFSRIAEVYPGIVELPPTPSVVVDFGKVVAGLLSISFTGASNNTPGVRLAFSETLQYLNDLSDFSRSNNGDTITPGSDQIAVTSEPFLWTDVNGCQNGTQVCADGLHGFRYVRLYLDALETDAPITQPHGTVSFNNVHLTLSAFLGTPDTFDGYFECSDKELTKYWYDGAYTNDLTTDTFRLNDTDPRRAGSPSLVGKLVLYDGAKRDRDPYVGDLAVAARTAYVTHKKNALGVRNILADLADHQRADGWIPPASISDYELHLFDYPLWWVACSYDYLMYTNDITFVQEYFQTFVNVLDAFYPSVTNTTLGLLQKGLGVTDGYGDYAFLPRTGVVTYYNSLYVMALNNAAFIAETYGYAENAASWRARATAVSKAINDCLWDSTEGAFFDQYPNTTHAQDGNMISILAGITSADRASSILSYWSSLALPWGNPFYAGDVDNKEYTTRVYAFISYFELEARFENPDCLVRDSAVEEIRRLYGWMSTHDPGTTFWEGIGADGSHYEQGFTSACHGWSTGVTPALTNYVLGIRPTLPGFKQWSVKPVVAGGISWARGQVDGPLGAVTVDWNAEAGFVTSFEMVVVGPPDTKGTVCVPISRESVLVFVNGSLSWIAGRSLAHGARLSGDGYVCMDIDGSDEWRFRVSK